MADTAGRSKFKVSGTMDKAIDCNCSMWQKRGGLLWFAAREALTLETPAAAMDTCTFNTHTSST